MRVDKLFKPSDLRKADVETLMESAGVPDHLRARVRGAEHLQKAAVTAGERALAERHAARVARELEEWGAAQGALRGIAAAHSAPKDVWGLGRG